jgi:TniQ
VNPLPAPRKVPVVPRPRHGELSGSYLSRVAKANRIGFRAFLCLLGTVPAAVTSKEPDLAAMVLTLNDVAFTRLLAYTGLDGGNLIKAIPSLSPRSQTQGEAPAIRLSFLNSPVADCPGCRLRRGSAHGDTRILAHKAACLRHGYWLYG